MIIWKRKAEEWKLKNERNIEEWRLKNELKNWRIRKNKAERNKRETYMIYKDMRYNNNQYLPAEKIKQVSSTYIFLLETPIP
jgi:hypothetical protein